jgi:DNA-directed RNA polymerase subunit F
MGKPQVLGEESISMVELKAELKDIKKRDGELSFRAAKTEEYLDSFHMLKEKEAKDLFESIDKLKIPRFRKNYVDKIIDVLPRNAEELKMVLSAYPLTITNENISKIMKCIEEYLPDAKKTKDKE